VTGFDQRAIASVESRRAGAPHFDVSVFSFLANSGSALGAFDRRWRFANYESRGLVPN